MTAPINSAPDAVAPGDAPTAGRATLLAEFNANNRWTPGTPWRPLTLEQYEALRSYADPANTAARHACEQDETQQEADGLACPVCAAPIGKRCFGPDARSNHPARAIAHWDARASARGQFADLVAGTEPEPRPARAAETYVPPPGLWTASATMAFIGSLT